MSVAAAKAALAPQETQRVFLSAGYKNLLLGLLLVAATLVLFNRVSHNGFVNFDDDRYVLENRHVQSGLRWNTVSWAFRSLEQANWHPLTWISHAIDCQLFQLNPAGHHYMNLLFHAMNALLLFLIFQWFTGYTGRSLMVAALFAIHPINVESIAWVAERKNVLCMLFCLLAVGAYGWYVQKPVIGRYLAVAVLFAMALMSKPMAITLPLVLLLLDYWPFGRMAFSRGMREIPAMSNDREPFAIRPQSLLRLFLEKLPLIALSAGSAFITMIAQAAGGAIVSTATRPLSVRVENAIVCYLRYLGKAIWPSHLAALYPNPHALPGWQVGASAIVLTALTLAVIKYRACRWLLVGWFWFLGTMVPMIGLVQVGNQAMADRYAYLPFVGLFVMIVWGVADWATSRGIPAKYLAIAGVTILVAFSAISHVQAGYWQDDLSLWEHTLDVTDHNFVAENNYGAALARQGRYDEAVTHFRSAAMLEPGDAGSQLNLGIYAQQHGDLKQAAARYELALRLATDIPIRASAYANLGTVYFAISDYTRARENFESAVKFGGGSALVFLELGLIAQKNGDWGNAINGYDRFVSAQPSGVGYLLLAQAFEKTGRSEDARLAFEQARHVSNNIEQAQQTVVKLLEQ